MAEYHAKTACVHIALSEAYETADSDRAPLFVWCLTVLVSLWESQGVLGRSRPLRTPMTGQRRTPSVSHPLGMLFADVLSAGRVAGPCCHGPAPSGRVAGT